MTQSDASSDIVKSDVVMNRQLGVGAGLPAQTSIEHHYNSDLDTHPAAQHHTLGKGKHQAAPGNHNHPPIVGVDTALLEGSPNQLLLSATTSLAVSNLGKLYVLSGGSFTVYLPDATPSITRQIMLRAGRNGYGDYPFTGRATITGSIADAPGSGINHGHVDGEIARYLFSGESALLWCDGAQWFKLTGTSIPRVCSMRLSSATPAVAQSIPNGAVTTVLLNAYDTDNGFMSNPGANRIDITRDGLYDVTVAAYFSNPPAGTRFIAGCLKNGTPIFSSEVSLYALGGYPSPVAIRKGLSLVVGDYLQLYVYQNTGGAVNLYGDPVGASCFLSATELPNW